jgi:gamma-butyrobetaine dioxygenase
MSSAADAVAGLLSTAGALDYLGEPVTVLEHLLQAGALAERAGMPPALVAAALLHDVGHLLEADGSAGRSGGALMAGSDNDHGPRGARWLARWFGPEVTEPVRLHVEAKRYLCATEPGYYGLLSQASRHTLAIQGGPMGPAQAVEFAASEHAGSAVAIRRIDEAAKGGVVKSKGIEHFLPLLRALAEGGA